MRVRFFEKAYVDDQNSDDQNSDDLRPSTAVAGDLWSWVTRHHLYARVDLGSAFEFTLQFYRLRDRGLVAAFRGGPALHRLVGSV